MRFLLLQYYMEEEERFDQQALSIAKQILQLLLLRYKTEIPTITYDDCGRSIVLDFHSRLCILIVGPGEEEGVYLLYLERPHEDHASFGLDEFENMLKQSRNHDNNNNSEPNWKALILDYVKNRPEDQYE